MRLLPNKHGREYKITCLPLVTLRYNPIKSDW
jgi:hypothetical protein